MGFTFDNDNPDATPIDEMHRLVEKDSRNQECIFPFIGGEELNSSPSLMYRRYVINFGEMQEEEASKYPDLIEIVEEKVKPARLKQNREIRARYWWRFGETTPALFKAIDQCIKASSLKEQRILVRALTSKHFCFAFLPHGYVYDQSLIVFALYQFSAFAALSSRLHETWARFFGSTMRDDFRYLIADCFETFPFPSDWEINPTLEAIGKTYYEFRADLMVRHNEGLTTTYNRFHDPDETNPDILKLRELHAQMDRAVLDAYGWHDIPTDCKFLLDYEDEDPEGTSKRKKPWRYRWPEEVHDEVLARLLKLNQERAEEEKLGRPPRRKVAANTKTADPQTPLSQKQLDLIPPDKEQLDLF